MERGLWTGPAAGVLVVGGTAALLLAVLLPETRPANLFGGLGLVLLAAALDSWARWIRRRSAPAPRARVALPR
ncbi:hypothetical protein ACI784_04870 [Geodermatophilus sp. SYSU D01186]